METVIVIQDGWKEIKRYPFLVTLPIGAGSVEHEGVERRVTGIMLDTKENIYYIIL